MGGLVMVYPCQIDGWRAAAAGKKLSDCPYLSVADSILWAGAWHTYHESSPEAIERINASLKPRSLLSRIFRR